MPVLGSSLGNVSVLRLDTLSDLAPGNKSFKLQPYVDQVLHERARLSTSGGTVEHRLISFGGVWSNHLHALAALGHANGIATLGVVRGDSPQETGAAESAMLADARHWGMELIYVSRSDYRQRNEAEYQQALTERYAPAILIPEGGASMPGARACAAIAQLISQSNTVARSIVLPVGTGTTLAGIAASLPAEFEVIGISALKGAADLEERVEAMLRALDAQQHASWRILHDHHCGGFARSSSGLQEFVHAFEKSQGFELDPVYTAKMMLAIQEMQVSGKWDAKTPRIAVHTGGLQGRRGVSWL